MQYAEVIVDIAAEKLDRTFSYRVPEALSGRLQPGSVVRVPFGGRSVRGYVVALGSAPSCDPEKLKDIGELVADDETQESRLVALAAWMSSRYGSTMIRALKTVFPVRRKMAKKTESFVSLTRPEEAEALLAGLSRKHQSARARAVEALLSGGMPEGQLIKKARITAKTVRELADLEILTVRTSEILRRATAEAPQLPPAELTGEQRRALLHICSEWEGQDRPVLLRGVTGSGKTLIYLELVSRVLEEGRQAIVLIPEIALTWQTVVRFVQRFGDRVSFLHSRLSEGERFDQMRAARSGRISVMVGPRSALFTPFPALGIIVIDEEHEDSYHSELSPCYHARETAIKRAELEGAHVVLGSATPSVYSAYRAEKGEFCSVLLPGRFGGSGLPETEIIDMREELAAGRSGILSGRLLEKMEETLARREQVMLFLNRRGYAGSITCRSCGAVIRCPHCDISLTRHKNGRYVCHYCGYSMREVRTCPVCGSPYIGGLSVGTEQVEERIRAYFPEAGVLRMDLDTTRGKGGHREILQEFASGRGDILIGTQMIVKGHDFPGVTLVGVLLADLSLNEADYRSSERTFQLVTQAAGRAGRAERPGLALIQTYHPEHYSIQCAAAQDYPGFYKEEMAFRTLMNYPPAGIMASLTGSAASEEYLAEGMGYLRKYIDRIDPGGRLGATGPAPAQIAKLKDRYRSVIYLRTAKMEHLRAARERIEAYIAANSGFADIQVQFDLLT